MTKIPARILSERDIALKKHFVSTRDVFTHVVESTTMYRITINEMICVKSTFSFLTETYFSALYCLREQRSRNGGNLKKMRQVSLCFIETVDIH